MNHFLYVVMNRIDRFTETGGKLISWLVLLLVLLTCYDVIMRYAFNQGAVSFQELEWHLFALIFLLGAAYTLKHDQHVRVDVIFHSKRINDRQRAWINLIGTIFFLIPFCLLVINTSWSFTYYAYIYDEGSPDPGGLPYRFLIKGAITVGFSWLLLQAFAELVRNILKLRTQETP